MPEGVNAQESVAGGAPSRPLPPERAPQLLADASLVLASAPELDVALRNLARLAVLELASWCGVDVREGKRRTLRRVAVACADPGGEALARSLEDYAFEVDRGETAPARVLAAGRPERQAGTPEALARGLAEEPEQQALLRGMRLTSCLCVPLVGRREPLGVLWLVRSGEEPGFQDAEVALALDLGRRAGLAVEEAQRRERLEEALRAREAQLRAMEGFVRGAPVGLARLDRELHLLEGNEAFVEALGVHPDALRGRLLHELVPSEARLLADAAHKVLERGEKVSALLLPERPGRAGGPPSAWEACLFPLWGPDGRVAEVGMVVEEVTALKQAREALRDEQERTRLVVQATNDVIYDWNLVSGRLDWSPAVSSVFGFPSPSVETSLAWWSAQLHPEDRERVHASLDAAIAGGRSAWTEEYRFRRADGSYAVVFDRGYIVRGEEGRPERMIGSMLDVTERTRREYERERLVRELQEERQRLETVLDRIPTAVLMAEVPSGRIVRFNKQAERVLRMHPRTLEELPGKEGWRCFRPDGRPYAADELPLYRALLRGETVVGEQVEAERGDGTRGTFSANAAPVRDAEGRIRGAVLTLTDISERHQAEQERDALLAEAQAARAEAERRGAELAGAAEGLRAQQAWLEEVLDAAPTPLLLLEPETARVTFANRAARQDEDGASLLLAAVEPWRRQNGRFDPRAFGVPFDQLPGVRAARGETLRGVPLEWTARDGRHRVLASSARLPGRPGHPATVVLAFLDVTEQRRAQEALEQALRARDEFLAVAAHELRTPLTSLKLIVQRLEQAPDPLAGPAARVALAQRVAVVDRQVRRLERLIHHLFDVAALATGELSLQLEEVDLAALTREVVGRFREDFVASGSTLTLEADTPVVGRWDTARMEEVLENLVSNAIKYGEGRPIDVRVEGDADYARLTVRDRGIGVSLENQARIFERFERAVSGRQYSGLGLGLWVVRRIVRGLGGEIVLSSTPGEGSTFLVTLPRKGPPGRA